MAPANQPGVAESFGDNPVTGAITRRILMQRADLLKQYGPELVGAAVDNVADYVGDVEEIGSSDVSGWVMQVERMLRDNPPEAFAEGWSDAMVARRTGQPRTPYSVYIKGRKWKDFENDDHARAVMEKLKAKFKAEGRDPSVITIAPTDYEKDIKEMDKSQTPPGRAGDYPLGVKGTIGKPVTAKKVVKDLTKDLNQAFGKDKGIKEAGWDDAEATGKIPRQSMTESAETPSGQPTEIDPGKYYVWAWDGTVVVYGKYDTVQDAERNLPAIEQAAIKRVGSYVRGAFKVASGRSLSSKYLDKQGVSEAGDRVDPILIKALNRMPDGLATHGEVLNACYDAYAMELGRMEMKSNYGTTHAYVPQLMDLYKQKHGLTFKETVLNPRDLAGDLAAKRKALQDLSMNKDVDQQAVQQRKLDLDKEARAKGMAEEWSQKYKSSINCSHPKGFSQKAHCAGKKKHNESVDMEMVCEDCGMCETHGNVMEIKKGQQDSNGYTKCWSGYHAAGTKKSATTGKQVRNCVPNEGVAEAETDYSKRRQRERDVDAGKPVSRQPKNPQTDYARKRAKEKRDLEQFGESTNYWARLQNERNTKIASLVSELTESVKDIK
jgi:hypothetical protein